MEDEEFKRLCRKHALWLSELIDAAVDEAYGSEPEGAAEEDMCAA